MTIGVFAFGGFALAQMPHDAVRTAGSQQVGASYINDLTVSVGGQAVTDFSVVVSNGDLNETLPFSSTGIRRSNGTVIVNGLVTVRVTKPNSSVVTFRQRTDTDGRMRGFIYGGIVNQVGSYTLQIDPDQGTSASGTFTIKNKFDATNLTSGVLGVDRLPVSFLDQVGANSTGTTRHGKSVIDTEQTTSSTTYATLATPDEVTLTLPEDGILYVTYRALWKYSDVENTESCIAIFVDEDQVLEPSFNGDPPEPTFGCVGPTQDPGNEMFYTPVWSLVNASFSDGINLTADSVDGTAPQAIESSSEEPPTAMITAPAGTHTISIRYKAGVGTETVSVKERKLWVRTEGY